MPWPDARHAGDSTLPARQTSHGIGMPLNQNLSASPEEPRALGESKRRSARLHCDECHDRRGDVPGGQAGPRPWRLRTGVPLLLVLLSAAAAEA